MKPIVRPRGDLILECLDASIGSRIPDFDCLLSPERDQMVLVLV